MHGGDHVNIEHCNDLYRVYIAIEDWQGKIMEVNLNIIDDPHVPHVRVKCEFK